MGRAARTFVPFLIAFADGPLLIEVGTVPCVQPSTLVLTLEAYSAFILLSVQLAPRVLNLLSTSLTYNISDAATEYSSESSEVHEMGYNLPRTIKTCLAHCLDQPSICQIHSLFNVSAISAA